MFCFIIRFHSYHIQNKNIVYTKIIFKFRTLIEPRSLNYRQLVDKGLNAIGTDSSICPTHNLIRRDSSDNISESTEEISYQHHSNNLSTKSINIQAAVIHVIGDLIQSIGVFTSAIIIKFYVSLRIEKFVSKYASL